MRIRFVRPLVLCVACVAFIGGLGVTCAHAVAVTNGERDLWTREGAVTTGFYDFKVTAATDGEVDDIHVDLSNFPGGGSPESGTVSITAFDLPGVTTHAHRKGTTTIPATGQRVANAYDFNPKITAGQQLYVLVKWKPAPGVSVPPSSMPVTYAVTITSSGTPDPRDGVVATATLSPIEHVVDVPKQDAAVQPIGPAGGTISTPDGRERLDVAPGDLGATREFRLQKYAAGQVPWVHARDLESRRHAEVKGLLDVAPDGPVYEAGRKGVLTHSISPGESLDRTHIARYNEETDEWEDLPATLDHVHGTISVELEHNSMYGIYADQIEVVPASATWSLALATLLGIAVLAGLRVRRATNP